MITQGVLATTGWRLRLLGGFRLEHDGRVVTGFTRRRQDVLVAYLALHPTQDLSRPAVAHLLWPTKSRRLSLNRLTEVLTLLNKQLQAAEVPVALIEAGSQTFHLGPEVRTDVQDFEDTIAIALAETDPTRQERMLEQAVDLHNTGLLPALDDPWVIEERRRLEGVRDHAARLLVAGVGVPAGAMAGRGASELPAVDLARYRSMGKRLLATPTTPLPPSSPAHGQRWADVDLPGTSVVDEVQPRQPLRGDPQTLAEECVRLVETAEPHLTGPDRTMWLDRLDVEREKVYEAIEWAIERERTELALRLTGALWRYWYSRQRIDEGRTYLAQALTLAPRPQGRWYAKAANGAGALALQQGDLGFARRRFEEALPIWRDLEDAEGIARVLDNLGIIAFKRGDRATARARYAESIAVLRQIDCPTVLAAVLRNAALVEIADAQTEAAERLLKERLALGRRLGDADVVAWTLTSLASVVQTRDGWSAARPLIDEAETLFEELRELKGVATCLRFRGYGAQQAGRHEAAYAYHESSLRISRAMRDIRGTGESLRYMAAVAEAQGDVAQAREYNRQALLLLEDVADAESAAMARTALAEFGAADDAPVGQG